MENAGANLLCRFDEMRPGAALLIAFAPAKAFIHFFTFHFQFSIKKSLCDAVYLHDKIYPYSKKTCKSFTGLFGNLLQRRLLAQKGELGF